MATSKPRKRTLKPLPTFNLTVERVSDMDIIQEAQDISRSINLKLTAEIAQKMIDNLQAHLKRYEEGKGYITVTISGRVTN